MATYVITGRDVNLSFAGGTDIDAQATSAGTDAQTVSFSFKVEQGAVTETFS
jgi:hypothetical protein